MSIIKKPVRAQGTHLYDAAGSIIGICVCPVPVTEMWPSATEQIKVAGEVAQEIADALNREE